MRILDGHPVPYALTVTRDDGREPKGRADAQGAAIAWLRRRKPEMRIVRREGHYFFYERESRSEGTR